VGRFGNACVTCRAVHSALGSEVTLKSENAAAVMREDEQDEKHPKGRGRQDEKVERDQGLDVIVQKRAPGR
jgi:hypothetical protein